MNDVVISRERIERLKAILYKIKALTKEREELKSEVERLRVAARMARARTTDSAVAYALDAALRRKEGDE